MNKIHSDSEAEIASEICIGEYIIRLMDDGKYWILNGITGEGMQTGAGKMRQMIEEFWSREF